MTEPEKSTAEVEGKFHRYTGNSIPWYVRLIWVGFWAFAVYYAIAYLFPSIQLELFPRQ
jgi:hypothetical protein